MNADEMTTAAVGTHLLEDLLVTACNSSCGKVMLSQVSVCPQGGIHGRGHALQGVMHCWGMYGREHVWHRCMHGRGA